MSGLLDIIRFGSLIQGSNPHMSTTKTADQSVTSNVTPATVIGMAMTLQPNETRIMSYRLDVGAALGTTGLKLNVSGPAGMSASISAHVDTDVIATTGTYVKKASGTSPTVDFTPANLASAAEGMVYVNALVSLGSVGGDVNLKFSQSTSSATALIVRQGSYVSTQTVVNAAPPPIPTPTPSQFVAESTTNGVAATSLTQNVPTGVADNDILIWAIHTDLGVQQSMPAGWIKVQGPISTVNGGNLIVGFRKAKSEPTSYTFTPTAAANISSTMLSYRATGIAYVTSQFGLDNTSTSSPWTLPSVNLGAMKDDTTLVWIAGVDHATSQADVTYTNPSGFTTRSHVTDAAKATIHVADKSGVLSGWTGPVSGSASGTGVGGKMAVMLALQGNEPAATTISNVPANVFNYSTYGGVPGASAATLKTAWTNCVAAVKAAGGGTIIIAPGTYDLGSMSTEADNLWVGELNNCVISGYGAKFICNTTFNGMPPLFTFRNPNNVTLAGLEFYDSGANPTVTWRGCRCIWLLVFQACSGFNVIDCFADNVGELIGSQPAAADYYKLTNMYVRATVKNSYYAVDVNRNGAFSKAYLTCHNVRRGFISYGCRNWDVVIDHSTDAGFIGSNGFISMADDSNVHVDNVNITLRSTGAAGQHVALIHFYHQQSNTAVGWMRNINARADLYNVTGSPQVFRFDHENASFVIVGTTTKEWGNITLSGSVTGSFSGTMIANPSVSSDPDTQIWVSPELDAYVNYGALPAYFDRISGAAGSLLLDSITAAGAYSLRKLRAAYTGAAIRVRRASDSLEQDIGFTSAGDLDEATLTGFAGSGTVYVKTIYDQSGNARNLTQATASLQPRIVNAGTIDRIGTRAGIRTDGVDDRMLTAAFTLNQPLSRASVTQLWDVPGTARALIDTGSGSNCILYHNGSTSFSVAAGSSDITIDNTVAAGDRQTITEVYNGASSSFTYNSGVATTGNPGANGMNGLCIGSDVTNGGFVQALFGEVILASGAWSAGTVDTIRNNQKAYWGTA